MSGGWKEHDGKGVPADAKPGVTIVRCEASEGAPFGNGDLEKVEVWSGHIREPWDWSNFGVRDPTDNLFWSRVIAYRSPSTDAAVETLKALAVASGADNPKRKIKEAMG